VRLISLDRSGVTPEELESLHEARVGDLVRGDAVSGSSEPREDGIALHGE